MRVVCAWCGVSLPDKEPADDPGTSHGMCERCWTRLATDDGPAQLPLDGMDAAPAPAD